MRNIDGDALIDKYGDWYTEEGTEEGYIGTIKGIVDSMPTIAPERKKGKWIIDGECIDCSVCRHSKWSRVPFEDLVKRFNFCPNCGADMRDET